MAGFTFPNEGLTLRLGVAGKLVLEFSYSTDEQKGAQYRVDATLDPGACSNWVLDSDQVVVQFGDARRVRFSIDRSRNDGLHYSWEQVDDDGIQFFSDAIDENEEEHKPKLVGVFPPGWE